MSFKYLEYRKKLKPKKRIKGGAPGAKPYYMEHFERFWGIPWSCEVKDDIQTDRILIPWAWYYRRHYAQDKKPDEEKKNRWLNESLRNLNERYGIKFVSAAALEGQLIYIIERDYEIIKHFDEKHTLLWPTKKLSE